MNRREFIGGLVAGVAIAPAVVALSAENPPAHTMATWASLGEPPQLLMPAPTARRAIVRAWTPLTARGEVRLRDVTNKRILGEGVLNEWFPVTGWDDAIAFAIEFKNPGPYCGGMALEVSE